MVVKSNRSVSSQQVVRHLDEVITSHRAYFAEWRSSKFPNSDEDAYNRQNLDEERPQDRGASKEDY